MQVSSYIDPACDKIDPNTLPYVGSRDSQIVLTVLAPPHPPAPPSLPPLPPLPPAPLAPPALVFLIRYPDFDNRCCRQDFCV